MMEVWQQDRRLVCHYWRRNKECCLWLPRKKKKKMDWHLSKPKGSKKPEKLPPILSARDE
jgi:hypothetical protein